MLVGKINDDVKSEEIVFPCLMKNRKYGFVVLFTDEETGTVVVNAKDSGWKLGEHHKDFVYASDSTEWTPVKSITIETTGE